MISLNCPADNAELVDKGKYFECPICNLKWQSDTTIPMLEGYPYKIKYRGIVNIANHPITKKENQIK